MSGFIIIINLDTTAGYYFLQITHIKIIALGINLITKTYMTNQKGFNTDSGWSIYNG
jgi:hypothetical protein